MGQTLWKKAPRVGLLCRNSRWAKRNRERNGRRKIVVAKCPVREQNSASYVLETACRIVENINKVEVDEAFHPLHTACLTTMPAVLRHTGHPQVPPTFHADKSCSTREPWRPLWLISVVWPSTALCQNSTGSGRLEVTPVITPARTFSCHFWFSSVLLQQVILTLPRWRNMLKTPRIWILDCFVQLWSRLCHARQIGDETQLINGRKGAECHRVFHFMFGGSRAFFSWIWNQDFLKHTFKASGGLLLCIAEICRKKHATASIHLLVFHHANTVHESFLVRRWLTSRDQISFRGNLLANTNRRTDKRNSACKLAFFFDCLSFTSSVSFLRWQLRVSSVHIVNSWAWIRNDFSLSCMCCQPNFQTALTNTHERTTGPKQASDVKSHCKTWRNDFAELNHDSLCCHTTLTRGENSQINQSQTRPQQSMPLFSLESLCWEIVPREHVWIYWMAIAPGQLTLSTCTITTHRVLTAFLSSRAQVRIAAFYCAPHTVLQWCFSLWEFVQCTWKEGWAVKGKQDAVCLSVTLKQIWHFVSCNKNKQRERKQKCECPGFLCRYLSPAVASRVRTNIFSRQEKETCQAVSNEFFHTGTMTGPSEESVFTICGLHTLSEMFLHSRCSHESEALSRWVIRSFETDFQGRITVGPSRFEMMNLVTKTSDSKQRTENKAKTGAYVCFNKKSDLVPRTGTLTVAFRNL